MWFEFFVLGSSWFWVLSAVEILVLFLFIADENGFGTLLSIAIFLILIHLFGDADWFSYIKDHPMDTLRWALMYMVLGFVWALVKLYYYTMQVRRKVDALRVEYSTKLAEYKAVDKEFRPWKEFLENNLVSGDRQKLEFSTYNTKIVFWMSYWPISCIWTLLNDPLMRFFKFIYNNVLIGMFRSIHTKILGDAYNEK